MQLFTSVATFSQLLLILVTICSVASRVSGKKDDVDKTTKIVGGRLARKNEVPYIVSLHGDVGEEDGGDLQFCGGSIYNKKWIITAAHCFDDLKQLEDFRIVAGSLDVNETDDGAQEIPVKRRIIHPQYTPHPHMYDIALLELKKELDYNSGVQPIPIPPPGTESSGKVKVSGWGLMQVIKVKDPAERFYPTKLMTLDTIVIIPREACDKYLKNIPVKDVIYGRKWSKRIGLRVLAKTALCAGHMPEGGQDSCFADSGGPLQCTRKVDGKPEKYLCGVVSAGYGCGLKIPGAYTEVAKFTNWIKKTTKT